MTAPLVEALDLLAETSRLYLDAKRSGALTGELLAAAERAMGAALAWVRAEEARAS